MFWSIGIRDIVHSWRSLANKGKFLTFRQYFALKRNEQNGGSGDSLHLRSTKSKDLSRWNLYRLNNFFRRRWREVVMLNKYKECRLPSNIIRFLYGRGKGTLLEYSIWFNKAACWNGNVRWQTQTCTYIYSILLQAYNSFFFFYGFYILLNLNELGYVCFGIIFF
jgi:hypothetical protein